MYNYLEEKFLKKPFRKFKEYRRRKRIGKWFSVNFRLIIRKIRIFAKSGSLAKALGSAPAVMTYLSVFAIAAITVGAVMFNSYAAPYFDTEQNIIRRLTMPEGSVTTPSLKALEAVGSSNRIQITLKTDTEDYVKPRGVSLEKGSMNIVLSFRDGETAEFSLDKTGFDTFESGMTDTFTLILPFGYTPFDVTEYTLTAVPDINGKYGSWHCKWATVYFLMGNRPVTLAKESWDDLAIFGSGDKSVTSSKLNVITLANDDYIRTETVYNRLLALSKSGLTDLTDAELKGDTLDSLALNPATNLYLDIETVNIDTQNTIFTYYTKGVETSEQDSLDYDGMMYLDLTFYSPLADGSFKKRIPLDTLGTDDFELGTTSTFVIELPEGMCAFDISSAKLVPENPYDCWAPRYARLYVKTDYKNTLELARITDTELVANYATPIFFKNLIEDGVNFDLTDKFCVSDAERVALEKNQGITLGGTIKDVYFKLMSFYDRQVIFYDRMLEIYAPKKSVTDIISESIK